MQYHLPLNFVLSFCKEVIPENGEDSYCYSFCDSAGMLGVFDGCGGAGAKKHACYSGKTEAYIASRLCSGAFYDCFRKHFPNDLPADRLAQELFAPAAIGQLRENEPDAEEIRITGSMVRTLPTTAAVAVVRRAKGNMLEVNALWAGDSRVYILDDTGLSQLTQDDTSVADPMENLYEDGVLKNIFCSDRKVKLHSKTVLVKPPFVVFAATDGCFGYVSTPMEFEGVLLHALLNADSPAQWEQNLAQMIAQTAADDHTMCLAAFGYQNFVAMQRSFSRRYEEILNAYLNPIYVLPADDRQSRQKLWEQYRGNYMRYLEDSTT